MREFEQEETEEAEKLFECRPLRSLPFLLFKNAFFVLFVPPL